MKSIHLQKMDGFLQVQVLRFIKKKVTCKENKEKKKHQKKEEEDEKSKKRQKIQKG